jgi:hypothetical protein
MAVGTERSRREKGKGKGKKEYTFSHPILNHVRKRVGAHSGAYKRKKESSTMAKEKRALLSREAPRNDVTNE